MENNQYLTMFIEESSEYLQSLNQNLLDLEQNTENTEIVNELFRAAHTLKGMAGSMGFKLIAGLTHEMENVLDILRNGKIRISSDLMDTLFECVDLLEQLIDDVANTGSETQRDVDDVINKLRTFVSDDLSGNSGINKKEENKELLVQLNEYHLNIIEEAKKQGLKPYYIKVRLQRTCLLKAARAYLIFKTIENSGEIIHSIPSVQDIEDEKFEYEFSVVVLSRENSETLKNKIFNILEVESVTVEEIGEDRAKNKPTTEDKKSGDTSKAKRSSKSIRVDTDRLDLLMNLVSELIIAKNRIEETTRKSSEAREAFEYLDRVAIDLHNAVMKVRMVPLEVVFNRFPRIIRDLSKETKKKVNFTINGSGTEVDRTIIDEINDPLIHLIRNAVDHGLELPHERAAAGKPEVGKVELAAYYDGNDVVIEVRDDGRGIDFDKVAEKAISRGLVSREEIATLKKEEIIEFLFYPGFSTADKVSSISGRGVGLDVVKNKVESLGGVIEVETKAGQGTAFIIRLPLSLSIMEALIVRIGNEIYALPLSSVKEVIKISWNDIRIIGDQKVIKKDDVIIPFVQLDEKLNVPKSNKNTKKSTDSVTVVIGKKGEKLSAFSVDDFVGQQEIVIKPLGKYLSYIKAVSGATILGNGQVVPILDVNHLV